MVVAGRRNTEMVEPLSTTPNTVERHVTAVLAKLEVRPCAEAVHAAYELGLIPLTTQAGTAASALPAGKMGVP